VGFGSLFAIFYEQEFGLNSAQRGFAAAVTEPAQILGLVIGIPLANRLLKKDPALVLRFVALVGVVVAACFATLSVTPYLAVVLAMNMVIAASAAVLSPGVYSVLSLALPPRVADRIPGLGSSARGGSGPEGAGRASGEGTGRVHDRPGAVAGPLPPRDRAGGDDPARAGPAPDPGARPGGGRQAGRGRERL